MIKLAPFQFLTTSKLELIFCSVNQSCTAVLYSSLRYILKEDNFKYTNFTVHAWQLTYLKSIKKKNRK